MVGAVFHDLFRMDRYLFNQVNVSVKFYRSKPEFCLLSVDASPHYKIELRDIRLVFVRLKSILL